MRYAVLATILLPLSAVPGVAAISPESCATSAKAMENAKAALEAMIGTLRRPEIGDMAEATTGNLRAALLRANQAQRKTVPNLIELYDALDDAAREFRGCTTR